MTKICAACQEEKEVSRSTWKMNRVKLANGKIGEYCNSKLCLDCFNKRRRLRLDKAEQNKHNKLWREKNKEKVIAKQREYYHKNRDSINAKRRARYKGNPEARKRNVTRVTNYRDSNITYRINCYISSAVRGSVKDKYRSKVFDLLGYSLNQLMAHLESQFQEGMTWENHGEWHIDHIRPVCSFNFESKNDKEFKECWALSNLRPLWAIDNLRKGGKWEF